MLALELLRRGLPACAEGVVTPRKRLFVLAPICLTVMVAFWPAEVSAQHRVYRRPPRAVVVGVGFGYPAFGYPYYYNPYTWGYGFGYGFGNGYGFG